MPNIIFEPWVVTSTEATITWSIYSDTVPAVSSVRYRVWRLGDTPVFVTGTALTGSATLSITNFDGKVFAEVTATDAAGTSAIRSTEFTVQTRRRPVAPDWLTFSQFTGTGLTLTWGLELLSEVNTAWQLYHRAADGSVTLLATYPTAQTSATLAFNTANLNALFMRGVDADGTESEDSPLLSFTPASTGPTITVSPWDITSTTARVAFAVSNPYSSISWDVTREGESTPILSGSTAGTISVPVPAFDGKLSLRVAATASNLARRQVVSEVKVLNIVPRPPRITVQALSATSVRLLVEQAPDDQSSAAFADLQGVGLTLREPLPIVRTYTNLAPDTEYVFTARAINSAGRLGQFTEPLAIRTYAVISATPVLPGALTPGPVLQQMAVWLQGDLLEYFLQFTTDTRIRSPLSTQVANRPLTLYPFLDMIMPVALNLGEIIRQESPDLESYDASLVIDRAGDIVQKVAIWCERLKYGSVINKAF